MDIPLARSWVAAIAAAVAEQTDFLTQLDSAIGDADHGVNLHRGFTAVLKALESVEPASVGEVFVRTGSTRVSKVGGASGPLYGSAFRAVGKALPGPTATGEEFAGALRAGLDAVQKLGAAVPGDKTIVDAYAPAVASFEKEIADGGDLAAAAGAAEEAAADGMRATTAMQARKGRASYLGPRSVGHQDPGATSTWLLFRALADVVRRAPG
jgi:phosphoenolpyruvate---glycerone phosphotransferase subunit DhaL